MSATMKRTDARTWAPSIPKVVDLSHGAMATEHGIQKSEFDNFIANETSSYCGYKWELIDNIVHIYDMADYPHEKAKGACDQTFLKKAVRGGWDEDITSLGSMLLVNPDPNDSDWAPDSSYIPIGRLGPMGSHDKTCRYPTLVFEIAATEKDEHVIAKAHKYLRPQTAIEIVVVFLIRPNEPGAARLQVLKFERGQRNPRWRRSFADPVCIQAGDPNFKLQLPVGLLFANAPLPLALVGKPHVELDLFRWKQEFLRLNK